ncbi:MAG: glycosyltransferase family 2 protein, partial [Nakamurella sp.]
MTVAVVTIVAGRHQHLRNQQLGLQRGSALPDLYVVVGMDDPEALRLTVAGPLSSTSISILPVSISTAGGPLPLAAARNAGVAAAIAAGAETLILLDVDCIPSRDLVARYTRAVATEQNSS